VFWTLVDPLGGWGGDHPCHRGRVPRASALGRKALLSQHLADRPKTGARLAELPCQLDGSLLLCHLYELSGLCPEPKRGGSRRRSPPVLPSVRVHAEAEA
jgi:hypothetical protein